MNDVIALIPLSWDDFEMKLYLQLAHEPLQ